MDNVVVADLAAHALTACRTTLDGGRTDAVLAVDDGLVHLHGADGTWTAPVPIVSRAWLPDGAPVHRR